MSLSHITEGKDQEWIQVESRTHGKWSWSKAVRRTMPSKSCSVWENDSLFQGSISWCDHPVWHSLLKAKDFLEKEPEEEDAVLKIHGLSNDHYANGSSAQGWVVSAWWGCQMVPRRCPGLSGVSGQSGHACQFGNSGMTHQAFVPVLEMPRAFRSPYPLTALNFDEIQLSIKPSRVIHGVWLSTRLCRLSKRKSCLWSERDHRRRWWWYLRWRVQSESDKVFAAKVSVCCLQAHNLPSPSARNVSHIPLSSFSRFPSNDLHHILFESGVPVQKRFTLRRKYFRFSVTVKFHRELM